MLSGATLEINNRRQLSYHYHQRQQLQRTSASKLMLELTVACRQTVSQKTINSSLVQTSPAILP